VKPSRTNDAEITEWALSARRGDQAALEQFLRATQQDVWRFVANLAEPKLADDLTQETYLRALGSIRRFEGRCSARGWLLSIARRVVVDQVRAAQVRPRHSNETDWQDAAERAHRSGKTRFEEGVVLAELIRALDTDRREAFVLTQTLGLTYADAAEICDCPVGTIRSRVARAREDLVTALHDSETPHRRLSAV
jgi:RNA polymerase sigma-70 factor (ECF subfamily)